MGQLYYKTEEVDDKELKSKLPIVGEVAEWAPGYAVVKTYSTFLGRDGNWTIEIIAESIDGNISQGDYFPVNDI